MDYQEFIKPDLLVLVPVLYVIGLGLKKSKLKDKWIPFILGIIGMVLSALWVLSGNPIHNTQNAAAALFTAVTQGILAAGASVYANQLFVQIRKNQ